MATSTLLSPTRAGHCWSLGSRRWPEPRPSRHSADAVPLKRTRISLFLQIRTSALSILHAEDSEPAAGTGAESLPHAGHPVHVPARVGGRDGDRPRQPGPEPTCRSICVVMHICPTSGSSDHPNSAWSSTSTTFDETLPGPFSGTSSGWRPASSSPVGTTASTRSSHASGESRDGGVCGSAIQTAAAMNPLDLFYFKLDADEVVGRLTRRRKRSEGGLPSRAESRAEEQPRQRSTNSPTSSTATRSCQPH